MLVPYKVLLPEYVFESKNEEEIWSKALKYMESYPHYHVIRIENKFAICERILKEDNNG